ncbi:DUF475 domain-containing protein [Sphingomonas sp. 10B4]|uniref:DUF475 domain-containing protein n=1 Tax=Sphingomonas sp. 10B4 TaxID=3048575 RepID=UPI002AB367D5|nr:DUF475 domain-containing protein [Sphingomonas sp. 10B4]MDY7522580.1 DUF475 domain-containing protein [Sphingomonas sp. 10B4]MEB0283979.1 DUF475 domain-containing protein [Sphingomonas sp. 10B4]
MKNFYGSILFTIVCLLLAGKLAFWQGGGIELAGQFVFVAAVLGAMETSLSLDNAVVNASILKDMAPIWQRRFLTWGVLIAVFGMRIVFPILIVAVSAMISPWEAARIAVVDQARYEAIVTGAHIGISGFGGAFLLLVGLSFFFDPDREHVWLSWIERPLAVIARMPFAAYLVVAVVIIGLSFVLSGAPRQTFLIAAFCGVAAFFCVHWIGALVGGDVDHATGAVVRSGLGAFIYLEFLDASFSFDGVIGAFAITNDIVLIALGLGIGAMFVRSMTVALVHGGHLAEFRYLEHGAFYAILALATIMLLSIRIETPEIVTGLIGAAIIALSLFASVRHRKRHPGDYADNGVGEVILPDGDCQPDSRTR